MAVDSIAPVAAERVAAAWADALAAVEAETRAQPIAAELPQSPGVDAPHPAGDTFVERILGQADGDVAAAPARPAGTHAENGPETATIQMLARPQAPQSDLAQDAQARLPSAVSAHGEFALPAALLVPATLIGLQVEAAATWPTSRHGSAVPVRPEPAPTESDDGFAGEETERDAGAEPAEVPQDTDREQATAEATESPAVADWCEALTRALRTALAARIPPQGLLVAAEQWRRGRCVVLACPQGIDPAGPAWAFVLWPRQATAEANGHAGAARSLVLYGLRVEARLQWSNTPRGAAHWCHVRVVKEHHPRRGRQLVAIGAEGPTAPVPCEVQLGPVLARSLRWCEVCVHINAAKRFWAALGAQWSAHVVVCSGPLAGTSTSAQEESAC